MIPVHRTILHELSKIYGTKVARFIGHERLFPTWIGCLNVGYVPYRVLPVYLIQEYQSGVCRLPCLVYYGVPHAPGLDAAHYFSAPGAPEVHILISVKFLKELIGHAHRYVEIAQYGVFRVLAHYELHYIGVVVSEYTHVRTSSLATLLYHIRGCVEYLHERHRTGCNPLG